MFPAPAENRFLVVAKVIVCLLGLILFPLAFVDAVSYSTPLSQADLWFLVILHLIGPVAGFVVGAAFTIISTPRYGHLGTLQRAPFAPSAPEALVVLLGYQCAIEQFEAQRADYNRRSLTLARGKGATGSILLRTQYVIDCYKLAVSCALYWVDQAIRSAFAGGQIGDR